MGPMFVRTRLFGALILAALSASATAQTATLSRDDYARAERFVSFNTTPLVDHAVTSVNWLDGTHFWYRDHDASGDHYLRYDTATGQASPLFDQARMATALEKSGVKKVEANKLGITGFETLTDGRLGIERGGKHYICDAKGDDCTAQQDKEPGVVSPDKRSEAFIRDWNLWVRDIASGKETQLTTDGVENYGYATDNAGWKHTDAAILVWSPDSSQIATFQQDQRKTGDMYLVSTNVGHPKLEQWKYPLPGDDNVTMIERVVIHVADKHVVRLQMPADQHRSSLCDDISCGRDGGWDDVKWSGDSKSLAFVSTSRDHKQEWFRLADPQTGNVRTVFDEKVKTYFESGNDMVNWHYLPDTDEAIWFSERDGWGQLYLYSLKTGKLEHAITQGEGNVTQVLRVDPATRTIWFRGVGKEKGVDPYYQQFYKIGFDGKHATLLTPEAADHTISLSDDGRFFVDAYSTPTTPTITVLRDAQDGHTLHQVAKADISRLTAAGWQAPQPFTVKARDGKTDLYGLMFKPTHFDPSKKYPIVDYIYPGPQTGSVGSRSFSAGHGDHQALAELGFIVVAIDGMGTPWRSKAFHDAYFERIEDNTLPDQVAGLKELGKRYAWIDMDRVGIWGHSGGGNATVGAMFHYPDFFKVGIAESGNQDNRNYEDDWAEKWQGLLKKNPDGSSNYDKQANQSFAANLKGHLMLAHGTMDDNVPPSETLLVVDALIKANKDFDLVMIPNAHHGYGAASTYMMRRRWDYFVRYLMGAQPPKEYLLKAP
ncbi:S9 family peptidase [Dyella sp.]|uniref:S9 family peptidase n=1 Tax=Dyella sp. TaxID=1869338 RepID=UPI0039C8BC48